MLPTNLKPVEVLDLGIHGETIAYRMYDRLVKQVQVATLQVCLSQLKKDEKDHRKTLRAHRKDLFGNGTASITEEDAAKIFGAVDVDAIHDKESLIQVLYGAVRFEEYTAYFYEKCQYKIQSPETRIFMDVLASEGRVHANVIKEQIESIRELEVTIDDRGRAVEVY